jgi:hypothetical protein
MRYISFKDHLVLSKVTSTLTDEIGFMFKVSDKALLGDGISFSGTVTNSGINLGIKDEIVEIITVQSLSSLILKCVKVPEINLESLVSMVIKKSLYPFVFDDEELELSFYFNNRKVYELFLPISIKQQNEKVSYQFRKKSILDLIKSRNKLTTLTPCSELRIVIRLSKVSSSRSLLRPIFEDNIGHRMFQESLPEEKLRSNQLKINSYPALSILKTAKGFRLRDLERNSESSDELTEELSIINQTISDFRCLILAIEENKPLNDVITIPL